MNKLGKLLDKPIHSIPKPTNKFVLPDAKIGIEVEFERWDGTHPEIWWERHPEERSVRNDGTEFVTSGAGICGTEIIEAVEEICAVARKKKWSEGLPRAAIHIHLDVTDLDMDNEELATLISNYMIFEDVFFAYAGEWRKETGFCVPFSAGQADYLTIAQVLYSKLGKQAFKQYTQACPKYQSVNLNALPRFGTIEFRHLPTTFDEARIYEWINLILCLKKSAQDKQFQQPLKLLSTLGPDGFARRLFGDMYSLVAKYVDSAAVWEAVDNAMSLMAIANKFAPKASSKNDGWEKPPAPNPILEKKAKSAAKKETKTATDSIELYQQLVGQDVNVVARAQDDETEWQRARNEMRRLQQRAQQVPQQVGTAAAVPGVVRWTVNPAFPLTEGPQAENAATAIGELQRALGAGGTNPAPRQRTEGRNR